MANSPLLKIPLLSTSQSAKESTINTMISYLERSMNDAMTLPFAGGNLTLPETDLARYFMFKAAGAGATSILTIAKMKRMFVIDNIANGNSLTLSCTSDTLLIPAGGIVIVYCDGTNLISVADSTVMGGGGGATTFLGLTDTPNSFAAAAKFVLRVKNDLTGVEFHQQLLSDMGDVNVAGIADGYILQWDAASSKFIAVSASTGIPTAANVYWKDAVECASTGPLVLADIVVGSSIDTVTLTNSSEILLKDQTDKTENGIYYFEAGVLTRRADADSPADLPMGAAVVVAGGGQNAKQIFFVSNVVLVMGQDIEFGASVPAMTLLGLPDVADTPPSDKQVLTWNTVLGGAQFEPAQGGFPPLTGQVGKVLMVNPTETGVVWSSPGASSYPVMAGNAGKFLAVNSAETDAEWKDPPTELPTVTGNTGKVLAVKSDESGVEWITPPASPVPALTVVKKTENYTLVIGDVGSHIRMDVATANTLIVPTNAAAAFPIGTTISFRQVGAGQTTIAASSGVTIDTAETLKLRKAGSTGALLKVAANQWELTGDLELLP